MAYRDDDRGRDRGDRGGRDRDRDRDGCRIYVGNLPRDVREREIEDIFYKYGRIVDIALKGPFAFVAFEDPRDAKDAVRGRDGYPFADSRLRVEFSNGGRRERRGYSGKRSDYRCSVSGLPPTCSWQDLKDFCREAGDVLYTDVSRDGSGVVEFAREDDMLWALKNLDGRRLKTHLGDSEYIKLREERGDGDSDRRERRSRDRDDDRRRGRDDRDDRDDDRRRDRDDRDDRRDDRDDRDDRDRRDDRDDRDREEDRDRRDDRDGMDEDEPRRDRDEEEDRAREDDAVADQRD